MYKLYSVSGRYGRTHITINSEGGSNRHKQDVRKTQRQSDTNIHTHTSLYFSGRQRRSDRSQDKRRHNRGEALMILDLEGLYIPDTSFSAG